MRLRVRPAVPLAALLLAVLFPFAWAGGRVLAAHGPEKAVEAYLAALCEGRDAAGVSAGRARFQAAARDLPKAELVRADAAVAALGKGWADVLAFAELRLADGSVDAGWYRMAVVREDGVWKVVSFAEADPWPAGFRPSASAADVSAAAQGAFAGYLDALAGNRYVEAARFLCGPARRAHEAGAAVLGKAPLFRQAEVSELAPVWRRGNLMACRAEYRVDGREARAVVRFAKLSDGWHIFGVDQI